jgi:Subtilase family
MTETTQMRISLVIFHRDGYFMVQFRTLCSVISGLLLVAFAGSLRAQAQTRISPRAMEQIQALRKEKESWTPSERKVSSNLLREAKMRSGRKLARGVPRLERSFEIDSANRVTVDIRANVNARVIRRIKALGGRVVNQFPQFNAIRAVVPVDKVLDLAEEPDVQNIEPEGMYLLNKVNTSQGDVAHRAESGRSSYVVDGTGVTIGVISDSIESLATLQASGDLPATVNVLPGQAGSGTSEGTAMLEIVHDLAPGATLWFATAQGGEAQFAQNILDLQAAGCDVIVDDVGYTNEYVFQDGVIAQAVDSVTAAGTLYFSSAGNAGNLSDGTSGVWEGDYVATTSVPDEIPSYYTELHDFGGGINCISISGDTSTSFVLKWSDPVGGSGNDYDLIMMDSTLTTIISVSNNLQSGYAVPLEKIPSDSRNDVGNKLLITKYTGAARMLHLNANRGRFSGGTNGQIFGHTGATGCIAVAAVNYATADGGDGGFIGGAGEPVETFSSDGPRRIIYEADGTAITPGDFSSTGGTLRNKPEIAAADRVSTATPGFGTFAGTSAAAPHAAAIAALIIEKIGPGWTPEDVRSAMFNSAFDIEAAGYDYDSGYGIVGATASLQSLSSETVSVSLDSSTWNLGCIELQDTPSSSYTATNDGDVAVDLSIKATNGAGGWTLAASPGANAFSVDVASPAISLTTADQTVATNVAVSDTRSIGLTYNAPTSDTIGGGVDQSFTITLSATKSVP